MANYYYVKINNEKLTQEVAAEIFNFLSEHCYIQHFNYLEGHISYKSRGLINVGDILEKYNINDTNTIEIEDEFDYFYNSLSQEDIDELSKSTFDFNSLQEEV